MRRQNAYMLSGTRSCLVCENSTADKNEAEDKDIITKYYFCSVCKSAVKSRGMCSHSEDSEKVDKLIDGLYVFEDFISEAEENDVVSEIDKTIWKPSQSGRRKQDYGPQVNFKRKKVKIAYFNGLPLFSKFLIERMKKDIPSLNDFKTVELCNLEYIPERGSSIDSHFDDFWLWGERLVTINLLSSTTITMSHEDLGIELDVELPRRSLIVMSGAARYQWKHGIKRENITSRRLAVTLRELSPEFLKGGPSEALGDKIYDIAMSFCGHSVQVNMNNTNLDGSKINENTR